MIDGALGTVIGYFFLVRWRRRRVKLRGSNLCMDLFIQLVVVEPRSIHIDPGNIKCRKGHFVVSTLDSA